MPQNAGDTVSTLARLLVDRGGSDFRRPEGRRSSELYTKRVDHSIAWSILSIGKLYMYLPPRSHCRSTCPASKRLSTSIVQIVVFFRQYHYRPVAAETPQMLSLNILLNSYLHFFMCLEFYFSDPSIFFLNHGYRNVQPS